MATIFWKSGVSGAFNDADDWSGGVAPGSNDIAALTAAGVYTVTVSGDASLAGLSTAVGATLSLASGTLRLAQGTGGGANAGAIALADGAALEISATFSSSGLVSLSADTMATALYVDGAATLSGGGRIRLSQTGNGGDAEILGDADDSGTLSNRGETIEGAGLIGAGDGALTFINQTGQVNANVDDETLSIRTGNTVINTGVLKSSSGGSLTLWDSIDNTGGVIAAVGSGVLTTTYVEGAVHGGTLLSTGNDAALIIDDDVSNAAIAASHQALAVAFGVTLADDVISAATGSIVDLNSTIVAGGTMRTDAGSQIVFNNVLLDGSLAANTIGAGTMAFVDDGAFVEVRGSLFDRGDLTIGEIGGNYTRLLIDRSVSLSGGGKISLEAGTGVGFGYIFADSADHGVLTNLGVTIEGAGEIGGDDGRLKYVNAGGVVDGDIAGSYLAVYTGQTVVNNSTIEATDGGQVIVYDKLNNAGGLLIAIGAGSQAYATNTVTGGTVAANGGAAYVEAAASNLTLDAVNGGVMTVSGPTLSGASIGARGALSSIELNNGVVVTGSQLSSATGGVIGVNYATLDSTTSADVITAGAHVLVNNGGGLYLKGPLANAGEIDVGQAGSASYTAIHVLGAVSLNGAGRIVLAPGSGGESWIWGDSGTLGVLTNNGETISGAGGIGYGADATLTFINQAGLVNANVSGQTLAIDTGNVVVNKTMLEATAGGALSLYDSVTNAGATLAAFAGSALNVIGVATGGVIEAVGAVVDVSGGASGATVKALNGGEIEVLYGTLDDDATSAFGAGSSITLDYQSTVVGGSLAANGGATLTDVSNARLDGSASAVTIGVGTKLVVADGASLDVTGAIVIKGEIDVGDAASPSYTSIYVSGDATFSGGGKISLAAATSGYSWIFGDGSDPGTLTNQGDTIQGAGGIGDGDANLTFDNASGLILANAAGATLTVHTGNAFTNGAKMEATLGGTLAIYDSLANAGGLVAALAGSTVEVHAAASGGTLQAAGAGAALNISAEVSDTTVLAAQGGSIDLYEATLDDDATTVSGAGSTLSLDYQSVVAGGSLAAIAGGTIVDISNATLDGSASAVTIKNKLQIADGRVLYLTGEIVDKGEIDVGDAASASWTFAEVSGQASLSGGGRIVLAAAANGYAWLTDNGFAGKTLTNNGDTILGAGGIGYYGDGLMTFDNAAGLVEASVSGATLTMDTGNTVVNAATFAALNGAQLTIYDSVDNTTGLIEALAGGTVLVGGGTTSGGRLFGLGGEIEVQNAALSGATVIATNSGEVLLNGADVIGSRLLVNGAATFEVEGPSTLDGSGAAVVIGKGVDLQIASTTLTLKGSLVNQGTISPLASGNGTLDIDGAVTLSGTGTLTSTPVGGGSAYVYVYGDSTDGGALTNFNDVISGDGQFGGNGATLTLFNQALGVIDAAGANGLTIATGATVKNSGLLEATNPFSLASTGGLTVQDTLLNQGVVFANGGDVLLSGAVTGNGKLEIAGGSTLTVSAASSNTVAFLGAGEFVTRDSAGLTGRVTGFAANDAIDLADLAAATTSITHIAGTGAVGTTTDVTLTDSNSALSVTLHLLNQSNGQYGAALSDYMLSADGQGTPGTLFQLAASV